jgi:hypothetical protein
MTNSVPDQNIVKAPALQMRIEYAKVIQRILEIFRISTSASVHSATASRSAEGATRGFNIRAGTTSTR